MSDLTARAGVFINASGLIGLGPDYQKNVDSCDNGVLFTGEYIAMLAMNNELTEDHEKHFATVIRTCMVEPGLIKRSPIRKDYEGPDDYHGALLVAKYCDPTIAGEIIDYGWKHWGLYNSFEPGKWNAGQLLLRFPQLILAAYIAAKRRSLMYYLMRPFLVVYTAIVILLSGYKEDPVGRTDSRLLSWCIINICSPESFLVRLAAGVWYKRLYRDYGERGLRAVADIYFNCTDVKHPFRDYWVDKEDK